MSKRHENCPSRYLLILIINFWLYRKVESACCIFYYLGFVTCSDSCFNWKLLLTFLLPSYKAFLIIVIAFLRKIEKTQKYTRGSVQQKQGRNRFFFVRTMQCREKISFTILFETLRQQLCILVFSVVSEPLENIFLAYFRARLGLSWFLYL